MDNFIWVCSRAKCAPGEHRKLIIVEGYIAFRGRMRISTKTAPGYKDIVGDWLYKPETECWYCKGKSYPAEICVISRVD